MPFCTATFRINTGKNKSVSDTRRMEYRECHAAVIEDQLMVSLAQAYGVQPEDVQILSHDGPKVEVEVPTPPLQIPLPSNSPATPEKSSEQAPPTQTEQTPPVQAVQTPPEQAQATKTKEPKPATDKK